MINANPGFQDIGTLSSMWAMMEAAKSGASDAAASARSALPVAANAVSAAASATGFAIGFAASFPIFLVAAVVPKNNPLVHGCVDGGRAGLDLARQTVRPTAASGESIQQPLAIAVMPAG